MSVGKDARYPADCSGHRPITAESGTGRRKPSCAVPLQIISFPAVLSPTLKRPARVRGHSPQGRPHADPPRAGGAARGGPAPAGRRVPPHGRPDVAIVGEVRDREALPLMLTIAEAAKVLRLSPSSAFKLAEEHRATGRRGCRRASLAGGCWCDSLISPSLSGSSRRDDRRLRSVGRRCGRRGRRRRRPDPFRSPGRRCAGGCRASDRGGRRR